MKMKWNETGFWAEIIANGPAAGRDAVPLQESREQAALSSYGTFEGVCYPLELAEALRT
jgi:hypothetical protein